MPTETEILHWATEVALNRPPQRNEAPTPANLADWLEHDHATASNAAALAFLRTAAPALDPSAASWSTYEPPPIDPVTGAVMGRVVTDHDGSMVRSRTVVLLLWIEHPPHPPVPDEWRTAMTIGTLYAVWHRMPEDSRPECPIVALVRAWQEWKARQPAEGSRRRVDYVEAGPVRMSKVPGLANLAHLAPLEAGEVYAVEIDGEPFASPGPANIRRYRVQRTPGQIDAFPTHIDERATGGVLVQALANLSLTGDERNLLRRDLRGFGEVVCALTHPIIGAAGELIEFMGWPGGATEANIPRLRALLSTARHLDVDLGDGLPRWIFDVNAHDRSVGLDARFSVSAGEWWQGGSTDGNANVWRLSGGLWRPVQEAAGGRRGSLGIGYWGLPDRIIAGIEQAFSWGPSPGKGRRGRIPDAITPIRRGGPGPERVIPAWHVLRLAGEHITADDYRTQSKARHRYRNAVQVLKLLGYFCTASGTAPAGGTIEITRAVKGGNGREAALVVRASARFCAAYAKGQRGRRAWSSAPITDVVAWRKPAGE